MTAIPPAGRDHPSPYRHAVSPWLLLATLAVGPCAWVLQILVAYGVSSDLCVAARRFGEQFAWTAEGAGLVIVSLLCLLAVLGSLALSWRSWRRLKGEKPGGPQGALDVGEGRSRFLAISGVTTAVLFAVAILFSAVEPFIVPACWTPKP